MFKLAKYDIKGSYKFYLILFASSIILSLGIFLKQGSWDEVSILSLITVINIALFIVILVFAEKSFRNELYEDSGYLTFTLPISSKKILGSKILVALLWFIIATIVAGILEYTALNLVFNERFINMIMLSINVKSIFFTIIFSLFNILFLMITIYSAITISKVTFKNKKIGGFAGFIFFIIINVFTSITGFKISEAYPLIINLSDKINPITINGVTNFHVSPDLVYEINITLGIVYALAFLGLFMLTSYLLEKKVDL